VSIEPDHHIPLSGIVGSTAHGLALPGSDVDRLGVFIAPTVQVAGLDWHGSRETHVTSKPDTTMHEVGKYLRLALKCNPTITELLWLPYDLYEVIDDYGAALVGLRRAFLSTGYVRASYGGYARQQALRLAGRPDGTFSSDLRKRTAKHARHMLRLLRQGRQLLATGELTVEVEDPAPYWEVSDMDREKMLEVFEAEDAILHDTVSVLPDEPDRQAVSAYLADVRRTFLND